MNLAWTQEGGLSRSYDLARGEALCVMDGCEENGMRSVEGVGGRR